MFIGHFAAGLAAKKVDSRPSLGTMFLAAEFIDLLWPVFVLLGIERFKIEPGITAFTPLNLTYYPFSHGMVSVLIWSVLFGGVYYLIKKQWKGALVLGGVVFSHWILDFISHRPDLPLLFGGSAKVGLGLWYSFWLSLAVETGLYIAGAVIYLRVTRPKNKTGTWSLWALLVFLLVVYLMNAFGPPPTATNPVVISSLSMWLIVAWGYWADRNRTSTS